MAQTRRRTDREGARRSSSGAVVSFAIACAASVLLTAFVVPVYAADAFSTDWETAAKSRARLVAADARLAGLEIRLAPGAITYWRNPGDSGLPPTFDFAGSDNIGNVEPIFPAPTRIREADGGEAFGYDGDVVFPLRIKPRDPAKPTTLALRANYAVCEKVCLPAEARLTLTLPDASSPYADLVGSALAAAPREVSPNDFGELKSDGASGWRLCAPHEGGPGRDLFIEPPEGWWITVARTQSEPGRECFRLTLRDKPREAVFPVALRLTTGGPSPAETTVEAPEPR